MAKLHAEEAIRVCAWKHSFEAVLTASAVSKKGVRMRVLCPNFPWCRNIVHRRCVVCVRARMQRFEAMLAESTAREMFKKLLQCFR